MRRDYNKSMAAKPQIYDAQKLARFFGVSRKTIWKWCETGKLPAFKIGREWKIRVEDLQKLITRKVRSQENKRRQAGLF